MEPDGAARGSPNRARACAAQELVRGVESNDESGCTHLVLQSLRLPLFHDAAVVDDGDATRELIGFLEVLRREQHCRAVLVQAPHLVPQREAAHGVEAGRRLVEEEHSRAVDQREREVETPAHAA